MLRFTAAGAIVLVTLAVALALVARETGTDQAIDDARQVALVTARGVVEPNLTDAAVEGQPDAVAQLDRVVREFVLRESLVRVKLWTADGRIVYSDATDLIGEQYDLDEQELELIEGGPSVASVSNLDAPENRLETSFGRLLEVYVGVETTSGVPMLYEAYFRYDDVVEVGQSTWSRFAPLSLGALVLLQLVQIPFAWSLARRLRRTQHQRERLLHHAVEASDTERRRIAGDLHDGVVQELTGLTYELDAARLRGDEARCHDLVGSSSQRLRSSIESLRSLLVDLYPSNLAEEGLETALADMATRLERQGIEVSLDVDVGGLPAPATALLYRSAQEVLRNVAKHSHAERVEIVAERVDGSGRLVIDDDGQGFDADELAARTSGGHMGLRSLADLVRDAGGRLAVRSGPGQGTRVEVEVPIT